MVPAWRGQMNFGEFSSQLISSYYLSPNVPSGCISFLNILPITTKVFQLTWLPMIAANMLFLPSMKKKTFLWSRFSCHCDGDNIQQK